MMKYDFNSLKKTLLSTLTWFCLVACCVITVAYGQTLPLRAAATESIRREQLLNGLKLLMRTDAKDANVTVKLRVHSGAAFDPKGKEGVAALLAGVIFPNEQTRLFFEEELGGDLKVSSNQDFIEITASGRSENFERILDTVRIGVVNLPITPENFKKVQMAHVNRLETENQNLSATADAAVRKRLFGDYFPYGRSEIGTPESLAKIDRVDLIQARDRFLTADNATLAISGNFDPKFALRAVKQFFGNWTKADKLVPATFRQPEAPNEQILIVKQPTAKTAEIRFALRGAARNAADFAAVQIAVALMQERWQQNLPAELRSSAFVRHEAHVLPGVVIFGASTTRELSATTQKQAPEIFAKILTEAISNEEFNRAKTAVLNSVNQINFANVEDHWLDADTFRLSVNYNLNAVISAVSQMQAEAAIGGWQKQTPAFVVVTQSAE